MKLPGWLLLSVTVVGLLLAAGWLVANPSLPVADPAIQTALVADQPGSELAEMTDQFDQELLPIQIEYLRQQAYPGSELQIEQQLANGSNYQQFIVSYDSEGLKQYGLLTVPLGEMPESGWPVIIFNHGYIDPDVYQTTVRYEAYVDGFARNGYLVFKPDYRGHAQSEGEANGGYGNSDYITDVLNAVASVKQFSQADADRMGMWGHSMGGWITHRIMVVSPDIKVGVIWAGMVGGYDDLLELRQPYWVRQGRPEPTPDPDNPRRRWRTYLVENYGSPTENPDFWDSISAVPYLDQLSGPIQLQHAVGDDSVPVELSERFYETLAPVSPESELIVYQGDDHNLSVNFGSAMESSLRFFDEQLASE